MSKSRIKTVLKNNRLIFVPIVLIAIFLILTFFSRQEYLEVISPQGYHFTQHRDPYLNANYSDIDIIIDIEKVDPEAANITVSFFIRGWFTENYTDFLVRVQSRFSPGLPYKYLNISNRGGSPPAHFFYQIEDYDSGPYSHGISGYAERFPYDYYRIRYDLTFWDIDPDLRFPPNFDPSVDVYIPSEWSVKSFIGGADQGQDFKHRSIYLVLSRAANRISFYSSSFLFTFFEYMIIGSLVFIPSNKRDLSQRMMVLLTSSALVLTFYNTFTTKLLLGTVSYIQVFFVSVIFSNMILLTFSLLGTFYWSKQIDNFRVFDFLGLLLTSIIPLVLFLSHVFFLLPSEYVFLWGYYLDYRFMLWLTLYVPIIWASFRRKSGFLFVVTGFCILVCEIFDMSIQNSDFFLLSLSLLLLFLGISILIKKHVKSLLSFMKKLSVARA